MKRRGSGEEEKRRGRGHTGYERRGNGETKLN